MFHAWAVTWWHRSFAIADDSIVKVRLARLAPSTALGAGLAVVRWSAELSLKAQFTRGVSRPLPRHHGLLAALRSEPWLRVMVRFARGVGRYGSNVRRRGVFALRAVVSGGVLEGSWILVTHADPLPGRRRPSARGQPSPFVPLPFLEGGYEEMLGDTPRCPRQRGSAPLDSPIASVRFVSSFTQPSTS